ncbi:MAG: hypothetical protein ACI9NG_002054, partial [Hyphomonas sp.]
MQHAVIQTLMLLGAAGFLDIAPAPLGTAIRAGIGIEARHRR